MPSVSSDDAVLERLRQELRVAWAATAEDWRDQTRDDFHAEHLAEIERRVDESARAIRQLQNLVRDTVRACT